MEKRDLFAYVHLHTFTLSAFLSLHNSANNTEYLHICVFYLYYIETFYNLTENKCISIKVYIIYLQKLVAEGRKKVFSRFLIFHFFFFYFTSLYFYV